MIKNINFKVHGMSCTMCANAIEKAVSSTEGVISCKLNFIEETLDVEYDSNLTNENLIKRAVTDIGYYLVDVKEKLYEDKQDKSLKLKMIIGIICIIPMIIAMFLMIFKIDETSFIHNMYLHLVLATIVQIYLGYAYYISAFKSIKNRMANMDVLVSLGTTVAYLYSVYNVIFNTENSKLYFEASAMVLVLVLIGKYIEQKAKNKTSENIKSLINLRVKTATIVKEDNSQEIVNIEELKIGDIVIVKPGEIVPTDGIVTYGFSHVDESAITGESILATKTSQSVVIGGSINSSGSFNFKVSATSENTILANIVKLTSSAMNSKANIQKTVDLVASRFVPFIIIVALTTFFTWYFKTSNFEIAIINMVSVLVVACPCALGIATPTALAVGIGIGAKKGILIKDANSLELIAKSRTFIFDKTGTLTEGKLDLLDIVNLSEDLEIIKYLYSLEANSEHVIAKAIVNKYKEELGAPLKVVNFQNLEGIGISGRINGKYVLIANYNYLSRNLGLEIDQAATFYINKFLKEGKNVIGLTVDNKLKLLVTLADNIKKEASELMTELKKQNVKAIVLSGDNADVVENFKNELGIEHAFGGLLPEQKLTILQDVKRNTKYPITMIGDGINDAPSLAYADISISMDKATDIAIESSGIIIMNESLTSILKTIKISKFTISKIYQNLFWAFIYNIITITFAALGLLTPVIAGTFMALSSITVVINSLLLKLKKI